MDSTGANKQAEEYYGKAQALYNIFWSKRALHYGFWEKGTKNLAEAIDNENSFACRLLKLNKNDCVLDAGCGVGGTSLFIAEKFGAKVKGITLPKKQLDQAQDMAKKSGLENLVNFEIGDFSHMRFKSGTFTKIIAIEAACHASDKRIFLREAYRLLKSGGRIVIADGFLVKKNLNEREKEVYGKCLLGWKVPNLSHKDDFANYLKKAGFKKIKFYDKIKEVLPSSKRITMYGRLFFPFSLVLSKFRIIPKSIHENTICMINQGKTFKSFTVYGVFAAEK